MIKKFLHQATKIIKLSMTMIQNLLKKLLHHTKSTIKYQTEEVSKQVYRISIHLQASFLLTCEQYKNIKSFQFIF